MLFLISLTCHAYAQSGYAKIEIEIQEVSIFKAPGYDADENKPRARFWLDDNITTWYERDGNWIIPITWNEKKTLSTYINYQDNVDDNFKVRFLPWEEDGCGSGSDGDNNYNPSCKGASKDDLICDTTVVVSYKRAEPGVWHDLDVISCSGNAEAYIKFRWFPPTPPSPIPESASICPDEKAVQFKAKDNQPYSQYITGYEWQILKKVKVPIDNDSTCQQKCPQLDAYGVPMYDYYGNLVVDYDCYESCLYNTGYKYEFQTDQDYNVSGETSAILSYQTIKDSAWVRYREIYPSATSAWSQAVPKKHQFYKTGQPTSLETSVIDTEGNAIYTNQICEKQTVRLVANMPAVTEAHKFYWYKRADTNKAFTLIASTDVNEYADDSTEIDQYQNLQYGVVTRNINCTKTYSDTVRSAEIFSFQGAVSNIDYDIKPASCPDTYDGTITITSVTGGSDSLYYNIARVKNDGTVDRTTIHSFAKQNRNNSFVFKDLLPGSYRLQVVNGGGIRKDSLKDTAFDEAGYCFETFDINVGYLPELKIDKLTKTKGVNCYGGRTGEIQLNFSNATGGVTVTLNRSERKDLAGAIKVNKSDYSESLTNGQLTLSGLSWGYYWVNMMDGRQCKILKSDTLFITQPAPLALADNNITISDYNDSPISCYNTADAFIRIAPTGGNTSRSYKGILKKNGNVYQVKNFSGITTFDNLDAGTYTIEVNSTCGNGPTVMKGPFTITKPLPLTIDSVSTIPISCFGVPNGSITVSSAGGTGQRQFRVDSAAWQSWKNKSEEFTFNNLDSGRHIIEVQDVNLCSSPAAFSFYLAYPSPISFEIDTLIIPQCYGGSDGSMVIKPKGGEYDSAHFATETYQLRLSSLRKDTVITVLRDSLAIFSGLSSDTYQIIIEDADPTHACATKAANVFLPEPTPVVLQVTDTISPSCFGAEDGAIKVKASGGTPGTAPDYFYSIDGIRYIAPDETGVAAFDKLKAGNYTIYAVDSHHEDYATPGFLGPESGTKLCAGTLDFTLTEPDLIDIYTTMQPVACFGTSSGAITIDAVSGGTGDYTYQWEKYDTSLKDYLPFSSADPLHIEGLAAGSYRLTVQDVAACSATKIVEVTQSEQALSIDTVQVYPESCTGTANGKLQVFASGGYPPYTYQLNESPFRSYGFFEGLAEATYILTVRDRMGCETSQEVLLSTDTLVVEIAEEIPATAGMSDGLLRLNVSGGKNKSFYIDGTLHNTGTEFNGLSAGEHQVAIHYNNGCTWEAFYTMEETVESVPALRVLTKSLNPVSCHGAQDGSASVEATGGAPPYRYQWDDAQQQTDAEVKNLSQGTYTVIVTDADGNEKKHTVTIEEPGLLEIISAFSESPVCYGEENGTVTVKVAGGTPPYVYQWNDPERQTTAQATHLFAGTYTVTVTGQNGCQLSKTITVEEAKAPENIIEADEITLCTGQSVQLDAGAQWASYHWSSDHGFTSDERIVIIEQAGTYFLEVNSQQGCTVFDTLHLITSDHIVEARFLLPTEIIAGDTVALTEVSWPVPDYLNWSYSENIVRYKSEGEKEYVIFPEPGEYDITLEVAVGNCTDIIEKTIVVESVKTENNAKNARLGFTENQDYKLYPNPNHGVFNLKICLEKPQHIQISIYDPLFEHVYYTSQISDTDHVDQQIDVSYLKNGTYTLVVETPKVIRVIRFIVN